MNQQSNLTISEQLIVQVDGEIEEILPVFWKEIYEDIEEIKQALEQSDHALIQAMGHKVKGTAGGYGFDAVSDIGQSLELAAEQRDWEKIRRLLDELLSYLSLVKVVYI